MASMVRARSLVQSIALSIKESCGLRCSLPSGALCQPSCTQLQEVVTMQPPAQLCSQQHTGIRQPPKHSQPGTLGVGQHNLQVQQQRQGAPMPAMQLQPQYHTLGQLQHQHQRLMQQFAGGLSCTRAMQSTTQPVPSLQQQHWQMQWQLCRQLHSSSAAGRREFFPDTGEFNVNPTDEDDEDWGEDEVFEVFLDEVEDEAGEDGLITVSDPEWGPDGDIIMTQHELEADSADEYDVEFDEGFDWEDEEEEELKDHLSSDQDPERTA